MIATLMSVLLPKGEYLLLLKKIMEKFLLPKLKFRIFPL